MIIPKDVEISYYELILTENCNLRCKYCYDSYYSDRTDLTQDIKMDSEFINKFIPFVLETYDRNNPDEITFSFFGGEPTMNWSFMVDLLEAAKKNFNFKYIFTLNTNAILLNSKKIDFLINHNVNIGISIDGTERAHNINRIKKDGSNSWKETVKIIPEIIVKSKRINVRNHLLMVITENNYMYLEESYKFLLSFGVEVNLLFDYVYNITDEILESLKKQMNQLFIIEKLPLPVEFKRRNLNKDYKNQDKYCFTPQKAVSISPDGKMFFCHQFVPKMCELTEEYKDYYGDINSGWYNPEYYIEMTNRANFTKFKNINEECNNCPANEWCKGGCIAGQYHFTKDLNKLNENLCKLNLTINELIIKIS